jgi:hypothetical protein
MIDPVNPISAFTNPVRLRKIIFFGIGHGLGVIDFFIGVTFCMPGRWLKRVVHRFVANLEGRKAFSFSRLGPPF